MLTGNAGKENAGVNPLRGQSNVQVPVIWEHTNVYLLSQLLTLRQRKIFESLGAELPKSLFDSS